MTTTQRKTLHDGGGDPCLCIFNYLRWLEPSNVTLSLPACLLIRDQLIIFSFGVFLKTLFVHHFKSDSAPRDGWMVTGLFTHCQILWMKMFFLDEVLFNTICVWFLYWFAPGPHRSCSPAVTAWGRSITFDRIWSWPAFPPFVQVVLFWTAVCLNYCNPRIHQYWWLFLILSLFCEPGVI